jgi:hypothetical protein
MDRFLNQQLWSLNKTYDEDLLLFGITPEKVELYSQENGYISMQFSRIGSGLSSLQSSKNAEKLILISARLF